MRQSLLLALGALALGMAAPLAAGFHYGILNAADSHLPALKALVDAAHGPLGTATVSPTITPTFTVSPTFSVSPTFTVTRTPSPTRTASPTFSPSPSFSATRTITPTPTLSPSFSASPTFSATRTASPTLTSSRTRTGTPAFTPTVTPTAPADQLLLLACAVGGQFLGRPVASYGQFNGSPSGCVGQSCQSVPDPLTGSTEVTGLVAIGGGGASCAPSGPWVYDYGVYVSLGTADASAYRASGHLRFDLRLGPTAPSSLSVSVGTFLGANNPWVTLNPGDYNSAGFTAVSVPISSFNPDPTAACSAAFLLSAGFSAPPTSNQIIYYVDNVRWTGN